MKTSNRKTLFSKGRAFSIGASVSILSCGILWGCGEEEEKAGSVGEACYANGTCNEGLSCASNLCVDLNGGSSGGLGGGGSAKGVDSGACYQCTKKACEEEAKACPEGSSCGDVLLCTLNCGSDAACLQGCAPSSLSAEEGAQLAALTVCVASECITECSPKTADDDDADDSSSDSDGGSNGGGGGTGTGGGSSGTGGGSTGTGGGSSTPGVAHMDCAEVIEATGTPAMIDDFDHGTSWFFADESDGRVGTWEWEWNDGDNGRQTSAPLEGKTGMLGSGEEGKLSPGFLQIKCTTDDHCNNTDYRGWQNYAAVASPFVEVKEGTLSCYNASQFTGIKFRARSGNAEDSLGVVLLDPDADPLLGWIYKANNGSGFTLGSDWQEFSVPFREFKIPAWAILDGGPGNQAVNPASLTAIQFTVRSVVNDGTPPSYEYLKPYDIQIDDISFY